ncbi:AMP-binding protein [Mumia sp. ZJ430]|uniref:AMP-binding protein n=1 Tax=Mumia sp. ZJ430 TaxID=2708083 RepID=UPI00141E9AD5|nr:AMP-binding protein [Mumia sp. ZJ430]
MSGPRWFSPPKDPADPSTGRLNVVYDALDRLVVAGFADAPALRSANGTTSYVVLLEQVASMGGLMRALGVRERDAVALTCEPSRESVVALLAAGRVGATAWLGERPAPLIERSDPALVVADGAKMPEVADAVAALDAARPRAVVVVRPGEWPLVETRDVAWEPALKAGATDPAPVVPVAGGTALAVTTDGVSLVHEHPSLAVTYEEPAQVGPVWDETTVIAVLAGLMSGRGLALPTH